ncbi:hypothetical protein XENOCAPTIV_000216, partial [Xenoophorus captivus]
GKLEEDGVVHGRQEGDTVGEVNGVCEDQRGKAEVQVDGGDGDVQKTVVASLDEKGEGEEVMELEAPTQILLPNKRRSKRRNVVAAAQASMQVGKLATESKDTTESSDSDGSSPTAVRCLCHRPAVESPVTL